MENPRRRIVFVSRLPQAPFTGAAIRAVRFITGLARHHDVHAIFMTRERDAAPPDLGCSRQVVQTALLDRTPGAGRPPWRRLGEVLDWRVCEIAPFSSASLRRVCDAVAASRPDVVQVESSSLAPFVLEIRRRLPRVPLLLDCFDMEWLLRLQAARWAPGLPATVAQLVQAAKVARWEAWAFRAATVTFMASERERRIARLMSPSSRFVPLPNGADFSAPPLNGPERPGRIRP